MPGASAPWRFEAPGLLAVSGGMLARPPAGPMEESLHQGLKLVLMLDGALACEMPVRGKVDVRGPSLCAIADQGCHTAVQIFDPAAALHYVMLTIDARTCEDVLGSEIAPWCRSIYGRDARGGPLFVSRPAAPAMLGLARQILTSPLRGPGRRLYLTGKAMELAGLAIDHLAAQAAPPSRLTSAEIERLHAARDMLLGRLSDPPDLGELARHTGMNMRKLGQGFRLLFGATPAALVQSARLDEAHRLIASGAWSVSQAAWEVGYTPAAFATAFRRRFGISPSVLKE